jgi:DNA adenine methylase
MIEPFLKWPGGKRWLVKKYGDIFPIGYKRYLEPFLGAGAVFFHLMPQAALLSDKNPDLVNLYMCLKRDADFIEKRLAQLQKMHCSAVYYRVRGREPKTPADRAVRFLYLNRTCFNGIYRVNFNGKFNVPMGSKTLVEFPIGYLRHIANQLRNASIKQGDFERTLAEARLGDFAFIDPPYTVMHNNNNFVKYNSSLFSWSDQIRLSLAIKAASGRGALIMLSNADHPSVRALYRGFGHHYQVTRSSVLSANASFRRHTTELLVANFAIPELSGSALAAKSACHAAD